MRELIDEIRYAVRSLLRSPTFTCIAVGSLVLGITANTTVFMVARAALYRPLPVYEPQQLSLVYWWRSDRQQGISQYNSGGLLDGNDRRFQSNYSYPVYQALRESADGLAEVFGFNFLSQLNVGVEERSMAAAGLMASANYFSGLGLTPLIGRGLTDSDDLPGADPVAVVGHAFWERELKGDPGVVGRSISINGHSFTIVGVTPPAFVGISNGGRITPPTDITVSLSQQPIIVPRWTPGGGSLFEVEDIFWVRVMARRYPGVSELHLQSALDTVFKAQYRASSVANLNQAESPEIGLFPGARGLNSLQRRFETPLLILSGVVVLVILIACMNLASLALARGIARQRDSWIRLALGSGHLRLARQVLVESLVVAGTAGVLGAVASIWGTRILLSALATGAGPVAVPVRADWQLFGIAAVVSCAAGLLFGLFPAIRLLRGEGSRFIKSPVIGADASRLSGGRLLVLVQVAVSVPLLVGGILFLRTAHNLNLVDPGFTFEGLVLFELNPSLNGFDRERTSRYYAEVLERVEAIPGVASASLVENALLSGWISNTSIGVGGSERVSILMNRVGPRFFETMQMPLLSGRDFEPEDVHDAPLVAILNETAAREYFNSPSPVGRYFTRSYGGMTSPVEVVGVVRDSRYRSIRDEPEPVMFIPQQQSNIRDMHVVARVAAVPDLEQRIRTAMAEIDPDVPVVNVRTQTDQIGASLGTERIFTGFLVFFGCLALLLAAVGLHGVTTYAVSRRTSEIGLRIALGARQESILWLILRQVVTLAGLGLLIGVPVSLAVTRTVRAMLYGIGPNDPGSILAASLILLTVAIASGLVPAYRASKVDAIESLRSE